MSLVYVITRRMDRHLQEEAQAWAAHGDNQLCKSCGAPGRRPNSGREFTGLFCAHGGTLAVGAAPAASGFDSGGAGLGRPSAHSHVEHDLSSR